MSNIKRIKNIPKKICQLFLVMPKVLLPFLFIFLIGITLFSYMFTEIYKQKINHERDLTHENIKAGLARISSDYIGLDEIEPLKDIFSLYLERNKDIRYLLVHKYISPDQIKYRLTNILLLAQYSHDFPQNENTKLVNYFYSNNSYFKKIKVLEMLTIDEILNKEKQYEIIHLEDSLELFAFIYSETVPVGILRIGISNKIFNDDIANFNSIVYSMSGGFILLIVFIYFFEVNKIKKAEERLYHLAHYDHLTGLPNRVLFQDRFKQITLDANRNNYTVGLIYLDIDNFKMVNDTLGHPSGDYLLQKVTERLQTCVRENDTVARMGGDEFTVILSRIQRFENISTVAQKILDELSKPYILRSNEVFLGASIGIVMYPNDGLEIDTLTKKADIAMYYAKETGRNNYKFYDENINKQSIRRLNLESDLRHAHEKEEFQLYYQPQIDIKTGKLIGAEALIRWHREDRVVSPAEFIPLAEETGLIVPMGEWVIRTACRQNKEWQNAGFASIPIAVNISARQFHKGDINNIIFQILEETELDPKFLELELTESTIIQDADSVIKTLHELKAKNLKIAIDDFGTGYSSLSYLKRFPIDKLKIDKSFIDDVVTNSDDAALTSTIIAMGHNLNMKVIAEGVEDKEQLDFLKKHHCDYVQGYYFSQPLNVKKFTEVILEKSLNTPSLYLENTKETSITK